VSSPSEFLFHTHTNVIDMSPKEIMPKTSPILNSKFHKVFYAIKNPQTFTPKKCFLMPLPNENKVYLNAKENVT
jgi:hypothetical protein